jgi:hypothetical protein
MFKEGAGNGFLQLADIAANKCVALCMSKFCR